MNLKNPTLLQVNTRVYLNDIGRRLNRKATLDDIPGSEIEGWHEAGFDWIYLLSVWQTGEAALRISRSNSGWRQEFEETLHDLQTEDIIGSGFAIREYRVSDGIGGSAALECFRERISAYGMKLMLDFVPNHTAPDHPWVEEHPDYFITGSGEDLTSNPENFTWVGRKHGEMIFAHGRDPYFPGWPDTIQLNYGNPHLQEAMKEELIRISGNCDGLRCDMAMLLEPEVFSRTWGIGITPFWPDAISRIRELHPGFIMMGEVYWDMEYTMQQQGFNYTYDKRLYDRLRAGEATAVRDHLRAGVDYQEKLARFLENHDEQRAASVFGRDQYRAATLITFLTPGLKFFHQGQCQARKVRISPHLGRAPEEQPDVLTESFHAQLFALLKQPLIHSGDWQLLEPLPAWEGNPTHGNFIAFFWSQDESHLLVVVNYTSCPGQCRLFIPINGIPDHTWRLHDPIQDELYQREGGDLDANGLYVDLPGWGFHLFEVRF